MEYLVFKNVCRNYEVGGDIVKALNKVNFEVQKEELTVILGASGSGKSTLLNLLGGMDRVTSGQIYVDENDITELKENQITNYRRNDVGFVFQFYNLIPSLTAYENVDIAAKLGRSPLNVREIMKAVGLEKRMNHFPSEMSGGELQRASIARAICKNPKILLCDEPTGALDSETGVIILKLLQEMSQKFGKTVIVVTHNAAIAPAANKVIHLKDGKILEISKNEFPTPIDKVVW